MHRFYIPHENWNLDRLALDEAETHHALDVLRVKKGERAVVFNGRGVEATVEISEVEAKQISLRPLHHGKTPQLPCEITLGQAIPKGKNMELIVQKATELGVASIAPLLSERTVIQMDAGDAAKKQSKWQTIAIDAAKQCGQNWLPKIQNPRTPKEFFAGADRYDLMLIGSLQSDAMHLKKVLTEFHEKPPRTVLVMIGPEGDFTPAEVGLARNHGCRPVTLGPIILRTETAAIYCLSVLGYELFGR
ncbi:MAG: 16S rRNA (uracil(1498)-N(3))-methyltransferase [Verrucomicrobiota bacterium]|nr:16S rRNA (uracil(1498)-N(3))-methyltransferase [Verrucomicrobiota bacterium]